MSIRLAPSSALAASSLLALCAAVPLRGQGRQVSDTFASYAAHVAAANLSLRLGDTAACRRWLDGAPAEHRGFEWRLVDANADQSVRVLRPEQGGVWSVAHSPDGSVLATGGEDGTVKLFDAESYEVLHALEAHEASVYCVSWSADGARLVSSSGDATAKVWDASSGELIARFGNHSYPVSTARFSPDGATVASTSYQRPKGGEVRLWRAADATELRVLQHGYAPITAVHWSRDAQRLFVGSWDQTFKIFDLEGDGEPRVFPLGDESDYHAVQAMAFAPSSGRVALASKDDHVHVFDAATGAKLHELRYHSKWADGVAFSPDGTLLASGSTDQSIAIWGPRSGALVTTLHGHTGTVRGLSFSPDGRTLVTGSYDGTVRLWDVASMRRSSDRVRFPERIAYHARLSPEGSLLAVGFGQPEVLVLDPRSGRELRRLDGGGWVNWIDFTADGSRMLTAGEKGVFVWDPATGEELVRMETPNGVDCARFSPDATRIAASCRDRTARLFDARNGEVLHRFEHDRGVWRVAFAPDGGRLCVGGDRGVRVFDAESGAELFTLDGITAPIRALQYRPEGTLIATGERSGALKLWRADDGKLVEALDGHAAALDCLEFSPDGTRIATGGADYALRIWDVATRQVTLKLDDDDVIYALAWSRDGDRLVVTPLADRVFTCHAVPLRERVRAGAGR